MRRQMHMPPEVAGALKCVSIHEFKAALDYLQRLRYRWDLQPAAFRICKKIFVRLRLKDYLHVSHST